MIHGLLWLPLLAAFIGLAWAGRNEYQKIEAYRVWAEPYDRAKYDLYSVLGQAGDTLTWGQANPQRAKEFANVFAARCARDSPASRWAKSRFTIAPS